MENWYVIMPGLVSSAVGVVMLAVLAKIAGALGRPGGPVPKLDFAKDMELLTVLIDFKVDTKIKYHASSILEQKKIGMLKDDTIEKIATEVVAEIMEEISPTYVAVLSKYFRGREGVIVFVSNTVFTAVMAKVLGLNDERIFDIERRSRFAQIARANRGERERAKVSKREKSGG